MFFCVSVRVKRGMEGMDGFDVTKGMTGLLREVRLLFLGFSFEKLGLIWVEKGTDNQFTCHGFFGLRLRADCFFFSLCKNPRNAIYGLANPKP